MHSFQCESLAVTVTCTYFKRLPFKVAKGKWISTAKNKEYKMSKHKKTGKLCTFLESQMYLYPSVYFDFYGTVLLKQYIRWIS